MDMADSATDASRLRPWGSRRSGVKRSSVDGCDSLDFNFGGGLRTSIPPRHTVRLGSRDSFASAPYERDSSNPPWSAANTTSPEGAPRPSVRNVDELTWKNLERRGGGPAVALALHRKRPELRTESTADDGEERPPAQGTGGFNYIVLAAARNTILRRDDWVLVLGSKRFGRRAQDMGLLRGSCAMAMPARPSSFGHKPDEELLDQIKRELV